MFLFAAHIANWDAQWGIGLLGRLIKDQDRISVKANPAPAVFLADALDLCIAKNYSIPEELREDFRRLSLEAIEDEIDLPARQAMGVCLGRLGDPRIFDLRDPRAYVEVPAGVYPYGDKGETIEIASPFRIGRYPATNGQYQAFIDGGGYRDRQWWSQAGWAWLREEKVIEPRFWNDRRWNGPNQPVVGVSFWEAEACSNWAGGRLPPEQEWEAAAGGPHGFQYPWGNHWEDGMCNTSEMGLGVTSPVGLWPRARQSELGIEDLAGNVWEWCGSLYGLDVSNPNATRVLRGGSWFDNRDSTRSAIRRGSNPSDRDKDIGFRIVCSSPIDEH